LAAAAGLPNLKQDLLTGYKMGDMAYKVHLDGYDNLDYWTPTVAVPHALRGRARGSPGELLTFGRCASRADDC